MTVYRIEKFELDSFMDFFISSCFVHYRKPDPDIYRMALDIAQVQLEQVACIEDRPIFVQQALEQSDYQIIEAIRMSIWGLPVEIVLAEPENYK